MRHTAERHFCDAVATWLRGRASGVTALNHRFNHLALLTGDVVGWRGANKTARAFAACEVKLYPYPVGSAGYGAIGQALALRGYTESVYLCCVAAASVAPDRRWRNASDTSAMRALLHHCDTAVPQTFEEYLHAAEHVFRHFYGDLGLGFMIVHDEDESAPVRVLVEPLGSSGPGPSHGEPLTLVGAISAPRNSTVANAGKGGSAARPGEHAHAVKTSAAQDFPIAIDRPTYRPCEQTSKGFRPND